MRRNDLSILIIYTHPNPESFNHAILEHLTESLEKNGKEFVFELLTNIGGGLREDAQVIIQEMLGKVGIKVIPQKLEWSVYVDKLVARDFDAVIIGSGFLPVPELLLVFVKVIWFLS